MKEEKDILDQIHKCTTSIKKSTVEQTATMRAWSAKNKLNVDKYRAQVENELNEEADKGDDGKKGS